MIKCTLIYRNKNGATSDSIRFEKDVQMVPRVGDSIMFSAEEADFKVTDVAHIFDKSSGKHEIWVYYQTVSG